MDFSYDKLRGLIKEKFRTQDEFAKNLGMSRTSLNLKLNNASEFSQKEIIHAVRLLGIHLTDVDEYFFTLKVKKT